ncbi:hypothetical protein QJQ45_026502 [Haematococcus lacustris]|nr:hypothetical protein QJQ45_026502 [Haematococcus lacustris]
MAGNSNIGEKRLEEPKKECIASSKRASKLQGAAGCKCVVVREPQQQHQAEMHKPQQQHQAKVHVLQCMGRDSSNRL